MILPFTEIRSVPAGMDTFVDAEKMREILLPLTRIEVSRRTFIFNAFSSKEMTVPPSRSIFEQLTSVNDERNASDSHPAKN